MMKLYRRSERVVVCGVFLAVAAFTGRSLPAQQDNAKPHSTGGDTSSGKTQLGRLIGVFDELTSAPVADAEIIDVIAEQSFRTLSSGLIGLAGFHRQNDSAVVEVRKFGYQDTIFLVMLAPADTVPVSIFLHRATGLPAVITEALATKRGLGPLREFNERRSDPAIHGTFIGPETMRKNDQRLLGELVADFQTGRCVNPKIFRNGVASSALDLTEPVSNFLAIEYYSGIGGPSRFPPCSLLIWDRTGS
jgi:hypothetical protein